MSISDPDMMTWHYAYDALGNLMQQTDGVNAEAHTYTYDALDRLTGWEVTGGGFEAYTYDPATGSLASKAGKLLHYTGDPEVADYEQEYPDPPLHAVLATNSGDEYIYDANGNMTERHLADGQVQHLTYDAEGRLVGAEISFEGGGSITASYVYDGDGNQVIADVLVQPTHIGQDDGSAAFQEVAAAGGDLRIYIGQHFEIQKKKAGQISQPPVVSPPQGGPCPEGMWCIYLPGISKEMGTPPAKPVLIWRSYYLAGGKRIAMRELSENGPSEGRLTWFLSDHLGSTSLTVDEGGGVLAARRYDPWGSPRGQEDLDDLLTDYTYTGQRSEAALGLMYYVARWYDSGIGHFIQADTVVPEVGDPAAYDKYGYVKNNPMKYSDPTGFLTDDQINAYIRPEFLGVSLSDIKERSNLSGYIKEHYPGLYAFLSGLHIGDEVFGKTSDGFMSFGKAQLDQDGLLQFGTTSFFDFFNSVDSVVAQREIASQNYVSIVGAGWSNGDNWSTPISEELLIKEKTVRELGWVEGFIFEVLVTRTFGDIFGDFLANDTPGFNQGDWFTSYYYYRGFDGPLVTRNTVFIGERGGIMMTSESALDSALNIAAWAEYLEPVTSDSIFP